MIFDLDLFGKTYFLLPKKLLRRAIEHHAHNVNGTVLDVGCGQQPYRHLFECFQYVGVDNNKKVDPDIVAESDALPFKNESFDSIVCFEMLEHTIDPQRTLNSMHEVLKKKGTLLLTVPFEWPLHYEPHDYWRFTPYSLKILVEKAGFQVIQIERMGGVFAVIGSRFVDVGSRKMEKYLPLRNTLSFIITAAVFHPISLIFYALSVLFDRVDEKDAFGWLVVARSIG